MDLSITTDFLGGTGSPEPRLKAIAEAGFTHLHWCHQWNTDFLYSRSELNQIAAWLKEYDLQLLDIHGSAGKEKCWYSTLEYERQAGVELVINRIIMLHHLGGVGSLIMHVPSFRDNRPDIDQTKVPAQFEALKRSLDELMPVLEKYGVLIAAENMPSDTFELLGKLMADYPAERLGITYDSGHGNIAEGKGIERLEPLKGRLQALHLNDNDGSGDQHQPPFYGTVDWDRLAKLVASSSYKGRPVSFELVMRNTPIYEKELELQQKPETIRAYLHDTRERCEKVAKLVEKYRQKA
ncbi:MAG: sugar phosphate isomerase/epimerase [Lentisphaeria bacterium]|nr:sugar phosphate isomerase/epimerase [Lentisphaeria bacterium]